MYKSRTAPRSRKFFQNNVCGIYGNTISLTITPPNLYAGEIFLATLLLYFPHALALKTNLAWGKCENYIYLVQGCRPRSFSILTVFGIVNWFVCELMYVLSWWMSICHVHMYKSRTAPRSRKFFQNDVCGIYGNTILLTITPLNLCAGEIFLVTLLLYFPHALALKTNLAWGECETYIYLVQGCRPLSLSILSVFGIVNWFVYELICVLSCWIRQNIPIWFRGIFS